MATGGGFSRAELLIGSLDESAALALHLASGDVQNAFHHMAIPEWLRADICLRNLSAGAIGMTGNIVHGSRVSTEQKLFLAPLTLPVGFPGACSSVSMSGHQANCADLPLSLPDITDGRPPNVVGPNHSVGIRWNCADNFGAVSKGATLTDQCLDGLCDSFRRAGLSVLEVAPAALSAETLRMKIILSHGVCGHTDKRIFRLRSALRV